MPNRAAAAAAVAAAVAGQSAVAGDSRAVLGRKGSAVVLTSDHKASRDDEVQRVQVRCIIMAWST
jgi:serine/threonine protein phosphatase PrpC